MLTFKNSEIESIAKFLQKLELKNKASRARTRLVLKLDDKLRELAKDQLDLLEKYGQHDEDGNLIRDGNDNYLWAPDKAAEAAAALQELNEETASINIEEYRPNIKFLTVALNDLDRELSGVDANIYAILMEKLEEEVEKND